MCNFTFKSLAINFLLALPILSFSSCNNNSEASLNGASDIDQATYSVSIFLDRSTSMTDEYQSEQAALVNNIIEFASLNESYYGQRSVLVSIFILGNSSIAKRFSVELPLSEPILLRSRRDREDQIKVFKADLRAALKAAFDTPSEESSQLYRPIFRGIHDLASSDATDKMCVIISDFIHTGTRVNFYDYKPEDLNKRYPEISEILLTDTPLPTTLSEVEVCMVSQCDDKDAGDLSYHSTLLFERLFEERGAKVTVIRNL